MGSILSSLQLPISWLFLSDARLPALTVECNSSCLPSHNHACPDKHREEQLHRQNNPCWTWLGLPHFLPPDSVLPWLHRTEQSLQLPASLTLGAGTMCTGVVNLSAIRWLATDVNQSKMAASAYKLWMYMATGFLSKINFLFAITKMLQGQGIGAVLEKYD